jgi:hypothetical protein
MTYINEYREHKSIKKMGIILINLIHHNAFNSLHYNELEHILIIIIGYILQKNTFFLYSILITY